MPGRGKKAGLGQFLGLQLLQQIALQRLCLFAFRDVTEKCHELPGIRDIRDGSFKLDFMAIFVAVTRLEYIPALRNNLVHVRPDLIRRLFLGLKLVNMHAPQLIQAVADHLCISLIDVEEDTLFVADPETVMRCIYCCLVLHQSHLGLFAVGYVADYGSENEFALKLYAIGHDLHRHERSIFSLVPCLESFRTGVCNILPMGSPNFRRKVGINIKQGHPEKLVFGIFKILASRLIGIQKLSLLVQPENGVLCMIDGVLGQLQAAFQLLALGYVVCSPEQVTRPAIGVREQPSPAFKIMDRAIRPYTAKLQHFGLLSRSTGFYPCPHHRLVIAVDQPDQAFNIR